MESNEAAELREQLEALRQRFVDYVEANSITEQIDQILANHETLDGEATAERERRTRLGGKPRHLTRGRPDRPKMTDAERAKRAYDYSTRHDAQDIPALRNRIEALESAVEATAKAVNNLTVGMGKRGGVLGWLTGA
jgi:hypothetical protein